MLVLISITQGTLPLILVCMMLGSLFVDQLRSSVLGGV